MKNVKSILAATAITVGLGFAAQAQDTETRNLGSFSKVSAQEGIEVTLKKGNTNSAVITAKRIDLDEVLLDVNGSTLKIHLEGNRHNNVNVEVEVTFSGDLESIHSSSASSITCNDWLKASEFDVDVSSSGQIDIKVEADEISVDGSSAGSIDMEVKADEIEVDMSSAAGITLSGTANDLEVDGSSAGELRAFDLEAKDGDISLGSGSTAKVSVSDNMRVRVSSGGSVRYKGSPRMDMSTSSGGTVKRG
ncbi:MAG: head GIN domain-containing protein [Bacteroidota bacterium]